MTNHHPLFSVSKQENKKPTPLGGADVKETARRCALQLRQLPAGDEQMIWGGRGRQPCSAFSHTTPTPTLAPRRYRTYQRVNLAFLYFAARSRRLVI